MIKGFNVKRTTQINNYASNTWVLCGIYGTEINFQILAFSDGFVSFFLLKIISSGYLISKPLVENTELMKIDFRGEYVGRNNVEISMGM